MALQTDPKIMECYETVSELPLAALSAMAPVLFHDLKSDVQRTQLKGIFLSRAAVFGESAVKTVQEIFSSLEKENRRKSAEILAEEKPPWLALNANGSTASTLNNYIAILHNDPHYKGVRFNLLKNAAEIRESDCGKTTVRLWCDADEAESMRYIEETYGIYSDEKHKKALQMLFRDREYNPVMDIVEALPPWDGKERISLFLPVWMGTENTPYTREVSRLIFAGGIHRLYEPGCKFDEVPVLIGTKQGEGKSTIIRFLAMRDGFYSEVTLFEGKESVEQLSGGWICEISEMLAMTKAKETESVKAFCSRQVDKVRKPYAKVPEEFPRRCIFIGTTNNARFLKDKTGNRRFYPVVCSMNGYDLFAREAECREYIRKCWAEARDKLKAGKMPAYADRSLADDYAEAQSAAAEDDWRIAPIEEFLRKIPVGGRVCVLQLYSEALLQPGEIPHRPSRMESNEIGLIMDRMPGWERMKNPSTINERYKNARGWIKVNDRAGSCPAEKNALPLRGL